MKKTISVVLILVFFFTLTIQSAVLAEDSTSSEATATLTSTNSSLEKILSPDQIKLFEKIQKIGTSLFGIRKTVKNQEKNQEKNQIASSSLEKIPSPDKISLFEKIQKIGTSLFGIRKANTSKATNALPVMNADLITCVSSAIDTKDAIMNITLTDSVTEITTAIDSRGTCQKTALALNSDREDAVKICNNIFQETTKAANLKVKKAQQESWSNYKTSLKACSTTASTTEINIEDGGDILE